MSKSWANPTWYFFHTLIEKIHPNHYLVVKEELMAHIKKICVMLPCPHCAEHATQFMRKVKTPFSKYDCKQMMFLFHNEVNLRIKKPLYSLEVLTMYEQVNLAVCYQLFREQFVKKTNNPKMFLDSMTRTRYIQDLDVWLQKNKLI
uniref:thiol oxidase n=1 Tax=viral metagenome TaxID=1070528 RepID=A0A6C0B7W1_9ZZZZ